MEHQFDDLDDGQLLAAMDAALDVLTADRLRLPGDKERMEVAAAALRVAARLHAWQSRYLADMERDAAVWREHGTSTRTWLGESHRMTGREASRLIGAGERLQRFGLIARAAETGAVSAAQSEAITSVLEVLPEDFDTQQVEQAQQMMIDFAAEHTSSELRGLGGYLVEVLDPVGAEEREAARLEREHRAARRKRHLTFTDRGDGAVSFRGSLPTPDAEAFRHVLDAHAAEIRRGLDMIDPETDYLSPGARRADALTAMVQTHLSQEWAPHHGGDRPRVVVTIEHADLVEAAAGAGYPIGRLLETRAPVPVSVLRQWLCDADIMPAVLGGAGEVLDVGRARRLVTPEIRRALEVRDQGCVFPGCEKPPRACHAHHIVPWWAGGVTSLANLVLVCAHHHGIVEPGHRPEADRWRVELTADGVAQVIPPRRVDREQRPRAHTRFRGPGRRGRRRSERMRPTRRYAGAKPRPASVMAAPEWINNSRAPAPQRPGHRAASGAHRSAGPPDTHPTRAASSGREARSVRRMPRADPAFPGHRHIVMRR